MPIRVARRRNSSFPPSVYERLKQLILDQKVASGAPLPEEELARTFGVSRIPIHEALVRLEKDRLVVLQPWRGAFVRGMTMDDVQELYQIREAVEGMAARLAAEMIGEEPLNQLGKNCEQLGAVRKYLVNNPEKVAADLQDHPMILDAIRRHDPEEAEQLMRRHIRAMRAALMGALK
jgi:DNA-binding GntR family transcriptional regulator